MLPLLFQTFLFPFFFNILVNLIMRNKTRSRWQLKHLHFHSHVIMMSLTPLDKCVINSSKEGIPAEQICCLKFQHNWRYNFFKVTPVDANLGFLQDQTWSTLWQWLMISLILPRRCNCCPSIVFVAARTLLKMSLFTGFYSFAKFEFLYRASSYNVNELLHSRMQLWLELTFLKYLKESICWYIDDCHVNYCNFCVKSNNKMSQNASFLPE